MSPLPTGDTGMAYWLAGAAQGSMLLTIFLTGMAVPASRVPLMSSKETAYLADTSAGTP